MNGVTIRKVTGWKIGKMTSTGTIRKIVRVNDNESAYLVCGVAGLSSSLNQQSEDKVKLMIDGVSQSTVAAWTLRKATRQMTQKGQSCGTFRIRKFKHMARKLSM